MSGEFQDLNESKSRVNPLYIFGLLFLPGFIIGLIFYSLLRYLKYKVSFISLIAGITSLVALIAGVFAMSNYADGVLSVRGLFIVYLLICVIAGAWGGTIAAQRKMREIRDNPDMLKAPGLWTYNLVLKKTPWEKREIRKKVEDLKAGLLVEEHRAPLGLDESSEETDVVYRYDDESVKHTLISGASGSGKTITMLSLIRKNILMHQPVVIIDMKRSAELASKIANWTKEAGGKFYHFVNGEPEDYDVKDSPGQAYYDPLSGGTPTSKADMILGMREYDQAAAHFKTNMQQVVQILFKMLYFGEREFRKRLRIQLKAQEILQKNPPRDPQKLAKIKSFAQPDEVVEKAGELDWDGGGLSLLSSALEPQNLNYLEALVKNTEVGMDATAMMDMVREKRDNPIKHSIQELQGQLRTINSSEYGRWLKTDKDKDTLNIFELTKEPGTVILFSLNSDSEPEFAKFIGSMILSDITNVSAKRRNEGLDNLVSVYVDEFQTVPPSSVVSLLEKSRASEMAMTLAQQSFDQIVASAPHNGQAYLGSILDTCSNFIVHAGSTEPSAEILAGIIGKTPTTKYIFSHGGKKRGRRGEQDFQTREEDDWKVPPSDFMELMLPDASNNYKSTAVVINKTSSDEKFRGRKGAVARTVWMIPDDKVIDDYYIPTFSDGERSSFDDLDNLPFFSETVDTHEPSFSQSSSEEMSIFDNTDVNEKIEEEDGGFGFESIDDNSFDDYSIDEKITSSYNFEAPSASSLFKGQGLQTQQREKPSRRVKRESQGDLPDEISGITLPEL